MRRVVITGMGLISPLGNTLDELWQALASGRSGVGPLTMVPPVNLPVSFAAEARQFSGDIDDFGPLDKEQKKAIRKGLKLMCRECQMGVAAAQRALADAGLAAGGHEPERSGCVFGSDYMLTVPEEFNASINHCRTAEATFELSRWGSDGMPQLSPLWLLKYLPNMPASHVAIYNDLRGPSNSITHREAASNLAIGEAFRTIARGHAEMMVAGATGTRVHPMKTVHSIMTEQLATNGQPPERASRPFDLHRSGMVLGEGAGIVVLEELKSAQARGARIYAEIVGHASSQATDRNFVALREVALANAIRRSLIDADAKADEVGHIHAHGSSTRSGDVEEAKAIRAVFGDAADAVPVTAAKSYFGNLGAGGGAVELICSILALQRGTLFPILNYITPDPDCPVQPCVETTAPGDSVLSVNVTPQGQASAVLVRQYRE